MCPVTSRPALEIRQILPAPNPANWHLAQDAQQAKNHKIEFEDGLKEFMKGKCTTGLSTAVARAVSVPGWGLSTAHSSVVDLPSHGTT